MSVHPDVRLNQKQGMSLTDNGIYLVILEQIEIQPLPPVIVLCVCSYSDEHPGGAAGGGATRLRASQLTPHRHHWLRPRAQDEEWGVRQQEVLGGQDTGSAGTYVRTYIRTLFSPSF